ncbi:hypothetical protein [Rhodococcus olei]|uniref:hypothetical protein n=1 Tax=Rhodococcus olei TaxID=2161675 RepID=UPI0031E961C9
MNAPFRNLGGGVGGARGDGGLHVHLVYRDARGAEVVGDASVQVGDEVAHGLLGRQVGGGVGQPFDRTPQLQRGGSSASVDSPSAASALDPPQFVGIGDVRQRLGGALEVAATWSGHGGGGCAEQQPDASTRRREH